MAETLNISKMAEKISDNIFSVFLWNKRGPTNYNWNCVQRSIHNKNTHPSDVVFWYDEPYRKIRTYVQTDLKSYQSTSIGRSQVEAAVISLAQQISCAEISEEYQTEFTHQHTNFEIVGLLFIYNHDGAYDRSFEDTLKAIELEDVKLPKGRRLYVFGPTEIHWLNNVAHDIQWLRGRGREATIPLEELCSFYHPQLVDHVQIRGEKQSAATLELLSGPWIILEYKPFNSRIGGFLVYWKDRTSSVDDFLYFIDFMRQKNMLHETYAIELRYIDKDTDIPTKFQSAQQQYAEQIAGAIDDADSLAGLVKAIKFTPINNVISTFSEEKIGMEYDR